MFHLVPMLSLTEHFLMLPPQPTWLGSFPASRKYSQSLPQLKHAEKLVWKTCGKATCYQAPSVTFMLATFTVDANIWKTQNLYVLLTEDSTPHW